ncbi:hypothetical protein HanHA89_Chr12g0475311 [Helianthus annuus]|nr:hypothetical protein HanHA89_Chr12g0475311 [Helianthus annuus]
MLNHILVINDKWLVSQPLTLPWPGAGTAQVIPVFIKIVATEVSSGPMSGKISEFSNIVVFISKTMG